MLVAQIRFDRNVRLYKIDDTSPVTGLLRWSIASLTTLLFVVVLLPLNSLTMSSDNDVENVKMGLIFTGSNKCPRGGGNQILVLG